jgi:PmbA protein
MKKTAQQVLALAKKAGADQAAVRLKHSRFTEVGYRDGDMEKASSSTKQRLSLRIYVKNRFGAHFTSDLRPETLSAFVKKAVGMTRVLEEDPFRGLPEKSLLAKGPAPDLKIMDRQMEDTPSEYWTDLARTMEKFAREKALQQKADLVSSQGGVYGEVSAMHLANSLGFAGSLRESGAFVSASMVFMDPIEKQKRRTGAWWEGERYLKDLVKPDRLQEVSDTACQRAMATMGARPGTTARMSVLVENIAAGRLLGQLLQCINGRAIYQKRSYLAGRKGEKVASDILHMKDDPLLPGGFSSQWFDAEGMQARPFGLIQNGVLKNYFLDTYHSRALHMEPTTGGASNVLFEPSQEKGLSELSRDIEKGIVVTSFLGGNFNSTTGDFSYGVQGRYVENGKVVHAVDGMNIAGNANDLWLKLAAVGNDPYPYSAVRAPSLLFENVQVSGT